MRILAAFALACSAPQTGPGADPWDCAAWEPPARVLPTSCDDVDASAPGALVACARGSGWAGGWTVDADGLPAYDLGIEHRCDPVGTHWSPRPRPQGDPAHLVGNGRGVVAVARASGAVELYSQDRGHTWRTRADHWTDPEDPDYPHQLGGGFSYIAQGASVRSTRYDDLPVATALQTQTRRFGVGYVETDTRWADLHVRRRVVAADTEARALVSEVVVHNPGPLPVQLELAEVWDPTLSPIPVELATSDLLVEGVTDRIERVRRAWSAELLHELAWDAGRGVATAHSTSPAPPVGPLETSVHDYYPQPLYLAPLGVEASAVWLDDRELWDGPERPVPEALVGSADTRTVQLTTDAAHGLLAVAVPVELGPGGSAVVRFAFGELPDGSDLDTTLAELESRSTDLVTDTAASWRERLVWAAFPGLPDAGVVQRELAWAAYGAVANTTYDAYRGVRVLGQGGAYRFIHGLDGAMGDLALFAQSMLWIDPELAADTLHYALASQHGSTGSPPWRFPYATTGVGSYSDVLLYTNRSDPYVLLPWMVASYVASTRDDAFLDRAIPYWPADAGERGTVLDHLDATRAYFDSRLGLGAGGLVAMGTGDYADGVLNLTDEHTSERGTSSTYNAGLAALGLPLAADVVAPRDPELAAWLDELATSQAQALDEAAWLGDHYARGLADSGAPLTPDLLFLEPQVLPIVAGLTSPQRTADLLELVDTRLETPIGAVSTASLAGEAAVGGLDQPQIGGVWPVANAWLTEAWAIADPETGWERFTRNLLARHADAFPELWYGVWTGPDSFYGPDAERPGEADAHLVTALTDFPALNAHVHTSPLRALQAIVGVEGTAAGLRIAPRVPTDTFSVHWPRLHVAYAPDAASGSFTPIGAGPLELELAIPSALDEVRVRIDGMEADTERDGDRVRVWAEGRAGTPLTWEITGS